MLNSVLGGAFGGALILLIYLIAQSFKRSARYKDFSWEEILNKTTFTVRELQDMYLSSVTFGECATGELFGALSRLEKELTPEEYADIEEAHNAFGNSVALMYAFREHPQKLEQFRVEALANYQRLKDLKSEFKLEWVNPFPEAQGQHLVLNYPLV